MFVIRPGLGMMGLFISRLNRVLSDHIASGHVWEVGILEDHDEG
jgi:hypothetical protein